MPPTDTVRPSRVWYWYWDSPSSLVIYWKAWDEEFQSKVVLVSLKDTVSRLASIQLHCIKPMSFIPFQWLQKKKIEWLTAERYSAVPLCGGCEALQALCCGGGAGKCGRREFGSGRSSLPPAGQDSTSSSSSCKQNRGFHSEGWAAGQRGAVWEFWVWEQFEKIF